jgi:hypothetical protein
VEKEKNASDEEKERKETGKIQVKAMRQLQILLCSR